MWCRFFFPLFFFSVTTFAANADYFLFREGYRYWQAGSPLKAYAVFESIRCPLPPIDDLRLYATAATALRVGRPQRAQTSFRQLIADYPASPWRTAAEQALLPESERAAAAEESPPLPTADIPTLSHYVTKLFHRRDYKKAVPVLEELLRRKGRTDVQLMMTLASAYARSSRYNEAIAMQRRIMEFPQEARRALYKIVFLQADRNHDKEAIMDAREYLEKYPKGAERLKVVWIEAWSHFRLREWTQALTHLETYHDAIGSREERRRADYWMARSLEMMGNKTGAATAYGVISAQDSSDYYGVLAAARLRHKPVAWVLPTPRKTESGALHTDSASALFKGLGMYEFMPLAGWKNGYKDYIDLVAPAWGLTPALIMSMIQVESHFYHEARSSAGAIGLMQLIPPTAETLVEDLHLGEFSSSFLTDPLWNVMLGMAYLKKLSGMFSRQMVPVIASYNAGEQAVQRWIQQTSLADPEIFIEEIPYDETYAYVKKVLTLAW